MKLWLNRDYMYGVHALKSQQQRPLIIYKINNVLYNIPMHNLHNAVTVSLRLFVLLLLFLFCFYEKRRRKKCLRVNFPVI